MRESRRFGLTLGSALLALALLSRWRGHHVAPLVLAVLGALLLAGALVAPVRLAPVERGWMRLAHAMSRVTTPLMLGLVWIVVLTPIALLRRLIGGNPLARRPTNDGYWARRERPGSDLERQF